MPKLISEETLERLFAMLRTGFLLPEACSRLDISDDTARGVLKEHHLSLADFEPTPNLATKKGEHAMWREAAVNGESDSDIAFRFGVSRQAVHKRVGDIRSVAKAAVVAGSYRATIGGGRLQPGDLLTDADGTVVEVTDEYLLDCEMTITGLLRDQIKLGAKLVRIRDGRLYLGVGSSSFAAFLNSGFWPLGRAVAYKYIKVAESFSRVHFLLSEDTELTPDDASRFQDIVKLRLGKQEALASAGKADELIASGEITLDGGEVMTLDEIQGTSIEELKDRLRDAEQRAADADRIRVEAEDRANEKAAQLREHLGDQATEIETLRHRLEIADDQIDDLRGELESAAPFLERAKTFQEKKTILLTMLDHLAEVRKAIWDCEITPEDGGRLNHLAMRVVLDAGRIERASLSCFALPIRAAMPEITPRLEEPEPAEEPEPSDEEPGNVRQLHSNEAE